MNEKHTGKYFRLTKKKELGGFATCNSCGYTGELPLDCCSAQTIKGKNTMNSDRIHEIHNETAYPDSISVQQALFRVWNETKDQTVDKNDLYDVLMKIRRYMLFSCTCSYTASKLSEHQTDCPFRKLSDIHDTLYNLMYGEGRK